MALPHDSGEPSLYLLASKYPVTTTNDDTTTTTTIIKAYEWEMLDPFQEITVDEIPNIYFIGKELAGNGIEYCLEYALETARKIK